MDNQQNKYSAFFKMFNPINLHVAFNIVGDDLDQHLMDTQSLINRLLDQGYAVEPQGLDRNEKIQEVQGWVLGSYNDRNTGKEEYCVYLYGPSYLQYKVATVWKEDIDKLPIKIPNNLSVSEGAPVRDKAVQRGVLNPCDFKIVLEPVVGYDGEVRKTDSGNVVMRFSRVYGQAKTDSSTDKNKNESSNSNSNEGDVPDIDFYPDDDDDGEIDSFPKIANRIDGRTQAGKLIKWARGKQNSKESAKTSKAQLEVLSSIMDEIVGAPGAGDPILSVLSGVEVDVLLDELKATFANSMLGILSPNVISEEGTPIAKNNTFSEKYYEPVKDIHIAIEEVLDKA